MTQTHIATVTVGSGGQASIDFTGIPQTGFTDLLLVCSLRDTSSFTVNNIILKVNGATTSESMRALHGTGSGVSSFADTPIYGQGASGGTSTGSTFGSSSWYFSNYNSSTSYKAVSGDYVAENNATAAATGIVAGLYASNTPITSLSVIPNGAFVFAQGSTASLYGISNTTNLYPKATGGTIISDGAYIYHIFGASGTFTALSSITADALIVAGGGGGGTGHGGGGGAGGYRTITGSSISAGAYPVVVGAGGSIAPNDSTLAGSGAASSVFSVQSAGGGGGGSRFAGTGASGGSGGGGSYVAPGGAGNTPATTPAQGTNGGGSSPAGGGGGGAGAAGSPGPTNGGDGGAGLSWSNGTYYAGGGGGGGYSTPGGAGGIGGGGAGGAAAGTAGTANTGGGGGGGAYNGTQNSGGAGGSGVVIIRYPK